MKRYPEAVEALQKAIALDQENAFAQGLLGLLLHDQLNQPREARKHLRKAIALNPNLPKAGRIREILEEAD